MVELQTDCLHFQDLRREKFSEEQNKVAHDIRVEGLEVDLFMASELGGQVKCSGHDVGDEFGELVGLHQLVIEDRFFGLEHEFVQSLVVESVHRLEDGLHVALDALDGKLDSLLAA